jgi:hypothetical protein
MTRYKVLNQAVSIVTTALEGLKQPSKFNHRHVTARADKSTSSTTYISVLTSIFRCLKVQSPFATQYQGMCYIDKVFQRTVPRCERNFDLKSPYSSSLRFCCQIRDILKEIFSVPIVTHSWNSQHLLSPTLRPSACTIHIFQTNGNG